MNYIKIIILFIFISLFYMLDYQDLFAESNIKNKSKDFSFALIGSYQNQEIMPKIAMNWYLSDDFALRVAASFSNIQKNGKDPTANGPDSNSIITKFSLEPDLRLNILSTQRSIFYFLTGIHFGINYNQMKHQHFNDTDPE